jgi:hypothetical protein
MLVLPLNKKPVAPVLITAFLVATLCLVALPTGVAYAPPPSILPLDAVQVWGESWNNMTLWLRGGDPLSNTPIDGIYTTSGDFPSLVFNTTEYTTGTDYSIYQFADSGTAPNMWFSVRYTSDNITANNYFSAFLLSGKEGDTQYSICTLADTWAILRNGSSMNMTGLVPGNYGVIDVYMHFDADDGYITTFIDSIMVDNSTSLDTSDAVGGFGFQVDSNTHLDDQTVAFSEMGAYLRAEDIPPTPTPHPAAGSGGFSIIATPTPAATLPATIYTAEENPTVAYVKTHLLLVGAIVAAVCIGLIVGIKKLR